jgi:hypothetical protein
LSNKPKKPSDKPFFIQNLNFKLKTSQKPIDKLKKPIDKPENPLGFQSPKFEN